MTAHANELLSERWLRRARRLNPFYRERLRWTLPAGWPDDVASAELALRVAAFQNEHGALTVDGILGPKTWEALQGRTFEPPAREQLIVGGERVAVPFPVVTWLEPGGLSFYGQKGWAKRRDPSGAGVNLFVLHWDGCTSSHQCFNVLLDRGLSVHLMLDGDGTVYQALDLAEARAWHAGNVNERSVGVEIQNPVRVHRNQWQTPPRPVVNEPRVHARGSYEHLDFYDVQKQRVVELAEVLCERFGIPRALPENTRGEVLRALAPAGFRGVCGHYHVSTSKPDPGLTLWPGLQAAFAGTQLHRAAGA
jgi:N-acetyl-anhydromuramyl-L-alanine amidase AmpD